MTPTVSYMEEAMEAVRKHRKWLADHGQVVEEFDETQILAAEPYVRKDERAKLEARLLSDEVVEIAAKAEWESDEARSGLSTPWVDAPERIRNEYRTDMRVALRAALASQETEEAPSDA